MHSGRRGGKRLVEECLTLDMTAVNRTVSVSPLARLSMRMDWACEGRAMAVARFQMELQADGRGAMEVRFWWDGAGQNNGERRGPDFVQRIALVATVPRFGGRRWWMLCPVTGARVRALHLPPGEGRFASRGAWGLAYGIERVAHGDRAFDRLARHQRRMGGTGGWGDLPARAKGQWGRNTPGFGDGLLGWMQIAARPFWRSWGLIAARVSLHRQRGTRWQLDNPPGGCSGVRVLALHMEASGIFPNFSAPGQKR